MNIQHRKEKLRAKLLNRRKEIPADEFGEASAVIIQQLKELAEFKEAETIHCYVSMNGRREVNTHGFIRDMLSAGKRVVVPVTNFKKGILNHVALESIDDLESNKWGVLEPGNGKQIAPEALDLVVIPMVGGDELGNRIGYGKGFYDRFLKEVSCSKIGLIFERNIVEQIPVEDFDIPLDKIITERRIIEN